MFNRKLKTRIKDLEGELGYTYNWEHYQNLESGDIQDIKRQLTALLEYFDLEYTRADYGSYRYKKREKKC